MVAMMGISVAAEKGWRKGPWTHEEDKLLSEYVSLHGEGMWSSVSKFTGLNRSGKSCRLRWVNYLRPGLKKGQLTPLEEGIIIELHAFFGNKWSTIAKYLPGRTDNEIKNYWRTHFKNKKKEKSKNNHNNKKLERNKARMVKQMKQEQQAVLEEQPKETNNETKSSYDETKENNYEYHQQDQMGFNMSPTLLEHQNSFPNYNLMHQEYYYFSSSSDSWLDNTAVDDDALWFSLWDFDEHVNDQLNRYVTPNQETNNTFGDDGGATIMQNLSCRKSYI